MCDWRPNLLVLSDEAHILVVRLKFKFQSSHHTSSVFILICRYSSHDFMQTFMILSINNDRSEQMQPTKEFTSVFVHNERSAPFKKRGKCIQCALASRSRY